MKINIKNIKIKSVCVTLFISLFLSCNNGIEESLADKGAGKGLNDIIADSRKIFLDAFVSFGNSLKESFSITSTTTKKAVGERLGNVGEAVKLVKGNLESLKEKEHFGFIKNKVETSIDNSIKTLDKIVNGVGKIKEATAGSADNKIGNATKDGEDAAPPSDTDSVKSIVEGIGMVYGAARETGIDPKGDATKTVTDSKKVGNLFGNNGSIGGADALKAAHMALTNASGADILAAIDIAAKGGTSKPAGQIKDATNAFDIAIATQNHGDAHVDVRTKGAVIAAGIALRAIAKDGKLATVATNAPKEEINAVLIGAVGKTINEIVSTIRRTVDKCLKNVSDCIKENSSSEVKSK
ncbi:variable large family protein (plasmid) [Borrelia coriaceae]|uniref:Variable large protein n=1 Tax=Borrelia coriaceae ATCC 43381 TaxID=1408429 RepID=W5SXE9_9SPIR|nr:Variable major outer membrane lipoprotein [Borrelia coriaceae ATCC 43381]UPA17307.1 variable large family protein [Borrelia coriaceae]